MSFLSLRDWWGRGACALWVVCSTYQTSVIMCRGNCKITKSAEGVQKFFSFQKCAKHSEEIQKYLKYHNQLRPAESSQLITTRACFFRLGALSVFGLFKKVLRAFALFQNVNYGLFARYCRFYQSIRPHLAKKRYYIVLAPWFFPTTCDFSLFYLFLLISEDDSCLL